MNRSDIPRSIPTPWGSAAGSSYIRQVPNSGASGGDAGYDTGFPPQTFQAPSAGGTPPDGRDFNGVLRDLSAWARWVKAGATVLFDPSFSAAVGGYPNGTVLASTTNGRLWQSTADGNTTDPDSASAANWIAITANFGSTANSITYPNGVIDQWGRIDFSSNTESVVAVSLAQGYSDGSYNISMSPKINGASSHADMWGQIIQGLVSSTGFSVQYQGGAGSSYFSLDGFYWRTIGR